MHKRFAVVGLAAGLSLLATPSVAAPGCDRGTNGDDVIRCSRWDDSHPGDPGDDIIYGGQGNDYLNGKSGNEEVYGGLGQDVVLGDEGQGPDRRRDGRRLAARR